MPTTGRKKKGKRDYPTSQLLNFTRDSYLERTSRPVYAIIFLLPFIVFYEIGTFFINTDALSQYQVRVVAFVWVQDALLHLGTSSRFAWMAPPLVVVVILTGLQIASQKQWYFCVSDYTPMVLECVFLAVPLIVLSLLFNSPGVRSDNPPHAESVRPAACVCAVVPPRALSRQEIVAALESPSALQPRVHSVLTDIVTGVGAGIYEELVFRLILICVLMMLFQDVIGLSRQNSIVLSVLISAGLFSGHHHIAWMDGRIVLTEPFKWAEFSFRTIAGVYFAILFAIRGFGITAGTHAFYDILATLVNAVFFGQ